MNLGEGVHTVPHAQGTGWCNKVKGRVLSRHNTKEVAEVVGREIARRLRVEHTVHDINGVIAKTDS